SSLRRRRDTAMQKSLDPQARRDNLADAFAWCGPSLAGRHVLLVDDVMTTGAALACLSLLLRTAGAGEISVLAVARTLPP
ncbi:ComF family protein, partial [Acinetobacter baumannii]